MAIDKELDDFQDGELENMDNFDDWSSELSDIPIEEDPPKGRSPSKPSDKVISTLLKETAKGVGSAVGTEVGRQLPKTQALVSEVADTFSDFKDMKEDFVRQMQPTVRAMEISAQKLLPVTKRLMPKRLYDKINLKLQRRAQERAEEERWSRPRSKEEEEQGTIDSNISEVFSDQVEFMEAQQTEQRQTNMLNQALASTRNKALESRLADIFDASRFQAQFFKTTYTAYLKKSLELKYRSLFVQKDIFAAITTMSEVVEMNLQSIVQNTGLPEVQKITNFERMKDAMKEQSWGAWGQRVGSYIGNFRKRLVDNVKNTVVNRAAGVLGGINDALGQAADVAEMNQQMEQQREEFRAMGMSEEEIDEALPRESVGIVPRLIAQGLGSVIGAAGIKTISNRIAPFTEDFEGAMGDVKNNITMRIAQKRQDWQNAGGWRAWLADIIPGFEVGTSGVNKLLTNGTEATVFDNITRQSIVEIIPGWLGKIHQAIASMYAGSPQEELAFDYVSRDFVSKSQMRENALDRILTSPELRSQDIATALGTLRAGYQLNTDRKEEDRIDFTNVEEDLSRIVVNLAVQAKLLDWDAITTYLFSGDENDPHPDLNGTIAMMTRGCKDPLNAVRFIYESIAPNGIFDKRLFNAFQSAVTRQMRRDAWRDELPVYMEERGMRRFFNDIIDKNDRLNIQPIIEEQLRRGASFNEDVTKAEEGAERGIHTSDEVRETLSSVLGDLGKRSSRTIAKGAKITKEFLSDHGFERFANRAEDIENFARDVADGKYKGDILKFFHDKFGYMTGLEDVVQDRIISYHESQEDFVGPQRPSSLRRAPLPEPQFTASPTATTNNIYEEKSLFQSLKDKLQNKGVDFNALREKGIDAKDLVLNEWSEAKDVAKSAASRAGDIASDLKERATELISASSLNELAKKLGVARVWLRRTVRAFANHPDLLIVRISEITGRTIDKGTAETLINECTKTEPGRETSTDSENAPAAPTPPTTTTPSSVAAGGSMTIDTNAFLQWTDEYRTFETGKSEFMDEVREDFNTIIELMASDRGGTVEPRKPGILKRSLKLGWGALKGVGSLYSNIYGSTIKGIGYVGGAAINGVAGLLGSTGPYQDIYLKNAVDLGRPLLSAKKQARAPGVVFADTGKRVENSKDIDRPVIDPVTKEVLISEEDIARGLVTMSNRPLGRLVQSSLMAAGQLGRGALGAYGTIYGATINTIGKVITAPFNIGRRAKDQPYINIYLKGEIDPSNPLLSRRQQVKGVYFKNGERVERSEDIIEPVFDENKEVLVTEENLKQGLVNVDGKPLGSGYAGKAPGGGFFGTLLSAGRFIGKQGLQAGNTLLGLYKETYGKLFGGIIDTVSGVANMFGGGKKRMQLMTNMDNTLTMIYKLLDERLPKRRFDDTDNDGDRDNSYEDIMQNRGKDDGDMIQGLLPFIDEEGSGGRGGRGSGGGKYDDVLKEREGDGGGGGLGSWLISTLGTMFGLKKAKDIYKSAREGKTLYQTMKTAHKQGRSVTKAAKDWLKIRKAKMNPLRKVRTGWNYAKGTTKALLKGRFADAFFGKAGMEGIQNANKLRALKNTTKVARQVSPKNVKAIRPGLKAVSKLPGWAKVLGLVGVTAGIGYGVSRGSDDAPRENVFGQLPDGMVPAGGGYRDQNEQFDVEASQDELVRQAAASTGITPQMVAQLRNDAADPVRARARLEEAVQSTAPDMPEDAVRLISDELWRQSENQPINVPILPAGTNVPSMQRQAVQAYSDAQSATSTIKMRAPLPSWANQEFSDYAYSAKDAASTEQEFRQYLQEYIDGTPLVDTPPEQVKAAFDMATEKIWKPYWDSLSHKEKSENLETGKQTAAEFVGGLVDDNAQIRVAGNAMGALSKATSGPVSKVLQTGSNLATKMIAPASGALAQNAILRGGQQALRAGGRVLGAAAVPIAAIAAGYNVLSKDGEAYKEHLNAELEDSEMTMNALNPLNPLKNLVTGNWSGLWKDVKDRGKFAWKYMPGNVYDQAKTIFTFGREAVGLGGDLVDIAKQKSTLKDSFQKDRLRRIDQYRKMIEECKDGRSRAQMQWYFDKFLLTEPDTPDYFKMGAEIVKTNARYQELVAEQERRNKEGLVDAKSASTVNVKIGDSINPTDSLIYWTVELTGAQILDCLKESKTVAEFKTKLRELLDTQFPEGNDKDKEDLIEEVFLSYPGAIKKHFDALKLLEKAKDDAKREEEDAKKPKPPTADKKDPKGDKPKEKTEEKKDAPKEEKKEEPQKLEPSDATTPTQKPADNGKIPVDPTGKPTPSSIIPMDQQQPVYVSTRQQQEDRQNDELMLFLAQQTNIMNTLVAQNAMLTKAQRENAAFQKAFGNALGKNGLRIEGMEAVVKNTGDTAKQVKDQKTATPVVIANDNTTVVGAQPGPNGVDLRKQ